MDETLGQLVRRRRLELGMNQTQLGEAIGIPGKRGQNLISEIETVSRKFPNADIRRDLARVLQVRHVDMLIAMGELLPEELPVEGAIREPFPPGDIRADLVADLQKINPDREPARFYLQALRTTLGELATDKPFDTKE